MSAQLPSLGTESGQAEIRALIKSAERHGLLRFTDKSEATKKADKLTADHRREGMAKAQAVRLKQA